MGRRSAKLMRCDHFRIVGLVIGKCKWLASPCLKQRQGNQSGVRVFALFLPNGALQPRKAQLLSDTPSFDLSYSSHIAMGLHRELGELFIIRSVLLGSIKKLQLLPLTTQEQGIRADFAARSIPHLHRESTPSQRARTSAGRIKGLVIPYWIRFKIVKEGSRQHND